MGNLDSTEIEDFHDFLTAQLENGILDLTPEESVAAFREYQRTLARDRRGGQAVADQRSRDQSGKSPSKE